MPNDGLRAALEVLVQPDRERHVEAVGEHHRLGARVDAHLLVVRDQLLAPLERIARVVAHAVEQLAEEEVEVAQERVHAADVGQRDAEVAAVLARPHVERERPANRAAAGRPPGTPAGTRAPSCRAASGPAPCAKLDVAGADEVRARCPRFSVRSDLVLPARARSAGACRSRRCGTRGRRRRWPARSWRRAAAALRRDRARRRVLR